MRAKFSVQLDFSMKSLKYLSTVLSALLFTTTTAFAHTGSAPVNAAVVAEKPYLKNLVRINAGAMGSGFYLGDGLIVTAAHNFTTNYMFLRYGLDPKITFYDGTGLQLNQNDYEVLLDPTSGIELKWDSAFRTAVTVLAKDVAILKIVNKDVLAKLPATAPIEVGGVKINKGMQIESLGLFENQALKAADPLNPFGRDVMPTETVFGIGTFTVAEIRESQNKIVATPDGPYQTLPGDSGAPMFVTDSNGKTHLVAIHHAAMMDPRGLEFVHRSIDQLVTQDSLKNFVALYSKEWLEKVSLPSAETIKNMPLEFWKELIQIRIRNSNMPTRFALQEIGDKVNAKFLWSMTPEESFLFAKMATRQMVNLIGDKDYWMVVQGAEEALKTILKQRSLAIAKNTCSAIFQ